MNRENQIIITHCVDPHHFYFKYLKECINPTYTKFDQEIQCYGNDLYGRKTQRLRNMGHRPNVNEIVIFFDLMFSKWIRGRVMSNDNDEIILWCIDNGIFRKSDIQFVQPLPDMLQQDLNFVHLGGLTLLPAESKLSFDTLSVKMEVTDSWDNKMTKSFKTLVDSSKRMTFIEEMEMGNHKFGLLKIESKHKKIVSINEILLQMDKVIVCHRLSAMLPFISEDRLVKELYQSYEGISSTTSAKLYNKTAPLKFEVQRKLSPEYSDDNSALPSDSTKQDDADFNQMHDGIVKNIVNLSVKKETDVSSLDERLDALDNSAGKALPSVCKLESDSLVESAIYPNKGNKESSQYECYLSAFDVKKERSRKPLQGSIDWINQFRTNVPNTADDKMSFLSGKNDIGDSTPSNI